MSIRSILFVCMGNICRSPSAHGVFVAKAKAANLAIEVDSAGTIGYHQGNPPDPRTVEAAKRRGVDLSFIRSRKIEPQDFAHYDLILVADRANLADLQSMAKPQHQGKIKLMLEYGEQTVSEIPDPYYGGDAGFEYVLDLIDSACDKIVQKLMAN